MKRTHFLKSALGLGLLTTIGCKLGTEKDASANTTVSTGQDQHQETIKQIRRDLLEAWQRSETMTMINVRQMPQEDFTFKYTEEAMTFAEQWRHCVIYTCGQLAGRAGLTNPYEDVKLPVQMPKEDVIKEMTNMYAFVQRSIKELSAEKLLSNCEFAGDIIPIWRLFYAMENHIIHHRGQCVVYLRLKGVIPKGYYGW